MRSGQAAGSRTSHWASFGFASNPSITFTSAFHQSIHTHTHTLAHWSRLHLTRLLAGLDISASGSTLSPLIMQLNAALWIPAAAHPHYNTASSDSRCDKPQSIPVVFSTPLTIDKWTTPKLDCLNKMKAKHARILLQDFWFEHLTAWWRNEHIHYTCSKKDYDLQLRRGSLPARFYCLIIFTCRCLI